MDEALRLSLIAGTKRLPGDQSPPAPADARTVPTESLSLEEHVGAVYRYALRLTGRTDLAEELAQETLLRGWRRRRDLRDARAARVWLLRIASNLWKDHLRRKSGGAGALFAHEPLVAEPVCPRPAPAEVASQQEAARLALEAMNELPARQRQVLHLVTCEGLSLAETADVLEISVGNVKTNLSLARKEMRRRLKDVYEEVCGRADSR